MTTAETAARNRGDSPGISAPPVVGDLLVVLGVGLGLWAFVVWQWQDPFTSLYTRWQQHKLQGVYAQVVGTSIIRFPSRTRRPSLSPSSGACCSPKRPGTAGSRRSERLWAHRSASPRAARLPITARTRFLVKGRDMTSAPSCPAKGARVHRRPPDDLPCAVRTHRFDEGREQDDVEDALRGRSSIRSRVTSSSAVTRVCPSCARTIGSLWRSEPPSSLLRVAALHRLGQADSHVPRRPLVQARRERILNRPRPATPGNRKIFHRMKPCVVVACCAALPG